jgi:drug/metabolite transporter (DMT)-like permease
MRLPLTPLVLALAWGLNWPAVKIMLSALPPFAMRALGLGGGALLLLLLALAQRRALWPPREGWPAIWVGAATVVGFNFCTAFAQLNTSTSRAAVLSFTMPMLAALIAWGWLGEKPGRRGMLALLLGGAGIAVLAWPVLRGAGQDTALGGPGPGASLPGLVFPLLAALAWAVGTVASKRWPPAGDRLAVTAWQLGLAAACGVAAAALAGERLPAVWPAPVLGALAFHIVIATALAYVLWYRQLEQLSATVSSLTTLAVPVVGVLGAMLLVGERPGAADALGFGLVLGGAALVLVPARRVRA